MRAAEAALVAGGTSVDELMQRAGRGAAAIVWRMSVGRPVTVLVGPGNNGGDGWVIAQDLLERGAKVSVVAAAEPATDAARTARALYHGPLADGGAEGSVLVDCLFGAGLTRPLGDDHLALLTGLAARHDRTVAIDLPSGVEADSGALLNEGLPDNHLTIALGAWKFAHWTMPALATRGMAQLVDIGIGPVEADATVLTRPQIDSPARDAHKYTRGLLAVVPGAMPGAALLAAGAAASSGAGYVKLAAKGPPFGHALPPELVVSREALDDGRTAAILVGPGLGRDDAARERLAAALAAGAPVVADADALHLLGPGQRAAVVTPHDGELAALERNFGLPGEGLRRERAQALARASGAVVLLKGADSLIAAPDGRLILAPPATSWLSVAGSGDVLAGLVAGRLAVTRDPLRAACEALWLHGQAARHAGRAFTASALVNAIREVL